MRAGLGFVFSCLPALVGLTCGPVGRLVPPFDAGVAQDAGVAGDARAPGAFDAAPSDDVDAHSGPSVDAGDAAAEPDAAVPPSTCSSERVPECMRGMYVSLYTDHIGMVTFDQASGTDQFRHILGDGEKEDALLAFVSERHVRSLSLYNLYTILGDVTLRAQLVSFMARARAAGVARFEAIGDTVLEGWDRIADFHANDAPFDGLLTEIEFWNASATPEQLLDTLSYLRTLALADPNGKALPVAVYMGWPEASAAEAIAPLVDRLYLHAYVDTAAQAFGYLDERMMLFEAQNQAQALSLEVWPIFSAEDTTWAAGSEHFMGEWLAEHSLDEAERTLLTAYEASGRSLPITGHQYYEYFFLERYLP